MGRRSDHSRGELEALIVEEGHRQIAEVGFARFSAREVAKRIGYSIGTLYNVFGSYDGLMLAINARTLNLWAEHLRRKLDGAGDDRIAALVRGYFDFATENYNAWAALYDHRLPGGEAAPEWYQELAAELIGIVAREIAAAVPERAGRRPCRWPALWSPPSTATACSPSTAPSDCSARRPPWTPPWRGCARRSRRRS